MKTIIRTLAFISLVLLSVSPAFSQQIKSTGTEESLPHKTVIIRDPGAEQGAAFLEGAQILRFAVYKAGSTDDVTRALRALRSAEGVKTVTEGPVSGDAKDFVIELNAPHDLAWYRDTFTKAGFKFIKLNVAPVKPISAL